ncbi:MAG TPA: DUF2147 domain-containing protein [Acidobacteriaceae bacterium]|nr:DUF2147 domain-containing protein [Acidobacteriaceae bacterium]
MRKGGVDAGTSAGIYDEMSMRAILALVILFFASAAQAQTGILGDWRDPTGSVIEIFHCGTDVCARMVAISKTAPTQFDEKNPDPAARKHSLCGLQIGYGFHLTDPSHADSGKLYDPKSGKTYRGAMTADGNQLHLRGYVGIKIFGRSETWTRTDRSAAACAK